MAVATPQAYLSASTNGRPIAIAAVASPGTPLHVANANNTITQFDEVWILVSNVDTAAHTLKLQWGGTSAGDEIDIPVQPGQTVIAAGGWRINNGLTIRGYTDSASKLNCVGWVNNLS
jgi:hypothetical protein